MHYRLYPAHQLLCSLSNHGCVEKADRIFDLGATAMALPMAEKLKYEQGDDGTSAG